MTNFILQTDQNLRQWLKRRLLKLEEVSLLCNAKYHLIDTNGRFQQNL